MRKDNACVLTKENPCHCSQPIDSLINIIPKISLEKLSKDESFSQTKNTDKLQYDVATWQHFASDVGRNFMEGNFHLLVASFFLGNKLVNIHFGSFA